MLFWSTLRSWLGLFASPISRMLVGWEGKSSHSWWNQQTRCALYNVEEEEDRSAVGSALCNLLQIFKEDCFDCSRHGPWGLWRRRTGAMMTGKSVKDVDRYQAVLNSLLALEENKFCADCESKGRCNPLCMSVNVHAWIDPTLDHLLRFRKMRHCIHHHPHLHPDQLRCTMVQDTGPHPYKAGAWHAATSCHAPLSNWGIHNGHNWHTWDENYVTGCDD